MAKKKKTKAKIFSKKTSVKKSSAKKSAVVDIIDGYDEFYAGISELLEDARRLTARSINAIMTAAYWETGRRIFEKEQEGKDRSAYGARLLERLSEDLTARFGRGYGRTNLSLMRSFYRTYQIVQTVSEQSFKDSELGNLAKTFPLSWSHYVELVSINDSDEREFYEKAALQGGWTIRQLRRQKGSQFYQRVLLSKNKAAMLDKADKPKPEDLLTPEEAIRDPYILEFSDLKDEYSESDLEEALIRHLEMFLLELGEEWAFVGRQKRLRVDDAWYRVDLVFFHRRLRSLVLIDLKLEKLTPGDMGQMLFYCGYARRNWTMPGENPPIGLILCAEKGEAMAEYALDMVKDEGKVLAAEYKTTLPDTKLIEDELKKTRMLLEERQQQRMLEIHNKHE